jgi:hypothetical protein
VGTAANGEALHCGTCTERAGLQGSCTNTDCELDLICLDGKCVASRAEHQSCDDERPCLPSLRCVGGTCAPPILNGSTCDPDAGPTCAEPLSACVGSSVSGARCAPVRFADASAECGLDELGNFTDCRFADCIDGRCVADANEGEPCDVDKGPYCTKPFSCYDNVCVSPAAPCK